MKSLFQVSDNGQIDFVPVFEMLNAELSKMNKPLELVCAGGYVMQLNGYRATADVDAFYKSDDELEKVIRKVGDEFDVNKDDELWLNNSISNMNPTPPSAYCKSVHQFSHLDVKAVDIIYLIGMKLTSAREQDLKDTADILKHNNIEQLFELLSKLVDMKFEIDISVLLDTFGRAYGIDWLEAFYRNNEAEISKYY